MWPAGAGSGKNYRPYYQYTSITNLHPQPGSASSGSRKTVQGIRNQIQSRVVANTSPKKQPASTSAGAKPDKKPRISFQEEESNYSIHITKCKGCSVELLLYAKTEGFCSSKCYLYYLTWEMTKAPVPSLKKDDCHYLALKLREVPEGKIKITFKVDERTGVKRTTGIHSIIVSKADPPIKITDVGLMNELITEPTLSVQQVPPEVLNFDQGLNPAPSSHFKSEPQPNQQPVYFNGTTSSQAQTQNIGRSTYLSAVNYGPPPITRQIHAPGLCQLPYNPQDQSSSHSNSWSIPNPELLPALKAPSTPPPPTGSLPYSFTESQATTSDQSETISALEILDSFPESWEYTPSFGDPSSEFLLPCSSLAIKTEKP